jgi:hypothetical protein
MADTEFPISKGWIQAMCVLLSPFCGAFLYYALRKNYPVAAKYANKWSMVSFLVWVVAVFAQHYAFGAR